MGAPTAKLVARGVVVEYWLPRSEALFTAVEGVDLEIDDGEFVAIVGPSGCGKTTFLNAVDGLMPIAAGSLTLDGVEIWNTSRKTALFITHDIKEAIYLADRVIVFTKRPGRVKEEIRVDLGRPRQLRVKRDPRFLE